MKFWAVMGLTLALGFPGVARVAEAAEDAAAKRPWTGYKMVEPWEFPPTRESRGVLRAGAPLTLYVNRHGGTYTYGFNNSVTNSTSLPEMAESKIPAATLSDSEWEALMRCVRIQYGPFGITITDEDPSPAEHIEAVVGGKASDIGWPGTTGGLAAVDGQTCQPIPSDIVFIFQATYGHAVQAICEVVAQESAHAIGLDHELLCEDPMTYLTGCGPKIFTDTFARCGEYTSDDPRLCMCDKSMQNSVVMLREALGPPEQIPPTVTITSPPEGQKPFPRFVITADAQDNYMIRDVEIFLDGKSLRVLEKPPFTITAPANVTLGAHEVKAVTRDPGGNTAETTIAVEVVPQCMTDADCGEGDVCSDYLCGADLGGECTVNDDCATKFVCAADDIGSICTETCMPSNDNCPDGYACRKASQGNGGTCWPAEEGGCAVPPLGGRGASRAAALAFALVGLGAFALVWRRRARR